METLFHWDTTAIIDGQADWLLDESDHLDTIIDGLDSPRLQRLWRWCEFKKHPRSRFVELLEQAELKAELREACWDDAAHDSDLCQHNWNDEINYMNDELFKSGSITFVLKRGRNTCPVREIGDADELIRWLTGSDSEFTLKICREDDGSLSARFSSHDAPTGRCCTLVTLQKHLQTWLDGLDYQKVFSLLVDDHGLTFPEARHGLMDRPTRESYLRQQLFDVEFDDAVSCGEIALLEFAVDKG